jgi:hypothetical protein
VSFRGNASSSALFPWLILLILISVFFRVIPWQMLVLFSVASLLLLLCVVSVFVCGYILFSYNLTLNLNI